MSSHRIVYRIYCDYMNIYTYIFFNPFPKTNISPVKKLFLVQLERYSLVVDQQGGGGMGMGMEGAMWHTPLLLSRPHHRSDVHHNEQFVRRGCQLGHFSVSVLCNVYVFYWYVISLFVCMYFIHIYDISTDVFRNISR